MEAETKKPFLNIFLLPIAGFSLFICLAFFFCWHLQVIHQKEENIMQNLQYLELSLVQTKESLSGKSFEEVIVPLNLCEYFLHEAAGDFQKHARAYHQLGEYLGKVNRLHQNLKSQKPLGAAMDKKAVERGINDIEKVLGQSQELLVYYQSSAERSEKLAKTAFFGGLATFLLFLFFLFRQFRSYVSLPLKNMEKQTKALMEGKDQQILSVSGGSLFKNVFTHLHLHQEHLQHLAQLAEQIGDGDFRQEADDFNTAGALGRSIGRMREKIQASFQDEEKRRWINEGIAQFSQTVRDNHQGLEELSSRLISKLVPYVDANQGGLFIAEQLEGEMVLKLKASYAWGRQKHLRKSFSLGDGLIGQVAMDKDMVLLTDIPDEFITIGSGMGNAKPACILILPLVAGEQLHGVLELASFKVFEEYQLEFLRRICEIVASAIAMEHGTHTTRLLLQEASEANTQLKAQEEELRQNTEELMSTQEAMLRKEAELEQFQEELKERLRVATIEMERQIQEIEGEKIRNEAILEGCVDGVISFNVEGKIEYFNKAAEEIWEISRAEAMVKRIQDFIPVEILVVDDELLVYYAKNGGRKLLDARTEVPVIGRSGQEMEVLLTLTRVKVEGAYTFTAFAQKVAVELF